MTTQKSEQSQEQSQKPVGPKTNLAAAFNKTQIISNVELVTHIMEFSRYGGLAQMVVLQALEGYARKIVDTPDDKLDELFQNTPFSAQSWKGVCQEIRDKMEDRMVHNNRVREHFYDVVQE